MTEPTDAEIAACIEAAQVKCVHPDAKTTIEIARAVLAKWGTPAGAGEVVDRADAVNLARNALGPYNCAVTKKGVRVLAEAVLSMDAALATPQPTQAVPPAGREPLTDAQAQELIELESWGPDAIGLNAQLLRTIRRTEAAHGIKGKEAGNAD